MAVARNVVGSVVPTAEARLQLWPLDATGVHVTGGLLGDRQRVNHDVTLHRGAEEL